MATGLPEEVENWLEETPGLLRLLDSVMLESKSAEETARALYHQGAQMLRLPKTLSDFDNEKQDEEVAGEDIERVALFEILAFVNYLHPDEDIIDRVLVALYVSSTGQHIEAEQAALLHYGSESAIPRPFFVFFFGKDIDAHIRFDNPGGESAWMDSGAVAVSQYGL